MLTLKVKEMMVGWLELNEARRQETFEFDIHVVFAKRVRFWQPQPFSGKVRLPQRNCEVDAHGYLTLKASGTHYEINFEFPGKGMVVAKGEKSFDLFNLKQSLTMCPLTLFKNGVPLGYCEVAYQRSLLGFPFRALRLTSY